MKVIKWLDEHFEETFLVFFLVRRRERREAAGMTAQNV